MDGSEMNGTSSVRVSFGTQEWWLQQPELATAILMLWRERQPAQFGTYLAEALTGTKPTATRGKS